MSGLLDCLLAQVRRQELLQEAGRKGLARELRLFRKQKADAGSVGDKSAVAFEERHIEVRRGSAEDMHRISDFLEFNGIPRWVAFEERFIVAEEGGRLVAVLRFREDLERLRLGLLVTGPFSRERALAVALYSGARVMAHGLGLREVRIHGNSHRMHPRAAGFHKCKAGWRVDVASAAS